MDFVCDAEGVMDGDLVTEGVLLAEADSEVDGESEQAAIRYVYESSSSPCKPLLPHKMAWCGRILDGS